MPAKSIKNKNQKRSIIWKNIVGQRHRFRCVIGRRGSASGYKGDIETVLLKDVLCLSAKCGIVDHLWFKCGKWVNGITEGDVIEFDARVSWYEKGYFGRRAYEMGEDWSEWDLRLERPTKVVVITKST